MNKNEQRYLDCLVVARIIAMRMRSSHEQSQLLHIISQALYPDRYNEDGQIIGNPKTFEAAYKCTCNPGEGCNYCKEMI